MHKGTGTRARVTQIAFLSLGVVAALIAVFMVVKEKWPSSSSSDEETSHVATAQRPAVRAAAPKPVSQKQVVVHPGQWSEWVTTPPNHRGRISPGGKVLVQDLRGNAWEDEPGKVVIRGDEDVGNFAFRFNSLEKSPVEVVIYYQPK